MISIDALVKNSKHIGEDIVLIVIYHKHGVLIFILSHSVFFFFSLASILDQFPTGISLQNTVLYTSITRNQSVLVTNKNNFNEPKQFLLPPPPEAPPTSWIIPPPPNLALSHTHL
jgi:hypothetical protein